MAHARRFRITTFQIIAGGFIALILLGTFLLMIPAASRVPGSAGFADSLFTATSAVCVTGLVVQDTATHWTGFGQAIILCLIQIGGMGIVTVAVFASFLAGRKIGLMQRSTLQTALSAPQIGGIVRLVRFIFIGTVLFELAGTLILLPVFAGRFGFPRGLWLSFFHSISAFCNAGFDLMGTTGKYSSLTSFAQHPLVVITMILLITIGGIGFLTWHDVRTYRLHLRRYRLQSKIVLLTSAVLILIPAVWFFFAEQQGVRASERVLPALFQSVTLRTAGFNTMDLTQISGSGQALMILWMLIGGSPGSTAGGMKTTTVAILILSAIAVFRRRDNVEAFGRRVPDRAIRQAGAILFLYLLMFFIGALIISRVEGLPLLTCLFETASAAGTVGLSLGITSELGMLSRGVLIVLMYFGRVGGLTLIYAAHTASETGRGQLPQEDVIVG